MGQVDESERGFFAVLLTGNKLGSHFPCLGLSFRLVKWVNSHEGKMDKYDHIEVRKMD